MKKPSCSLNFKLLVLNYLNQYENNQNIQDCHNAVHFRVQRLQNAISDNYKEIRQIVGQGEFNKQAMDIIEQEDIGTERQYQNQDHEQKLFKDEVSFSSKVINKKFNKTITTLQKASSKFQDIMFLYKKQLKQLAKDITKQRDQNKRLSVQIRELKTNSGKQPQSRSQSFTKISNNKGNVTIIPNSSVHKPVLQVSTSTRNRRHSHQPFNAPKFSNQSEEQEQTRQPPKPFCQQCVKRQNKENQLHAQNKQEKAKWRQLSAKITNLKSQLSSYEQQLLGKQSEIKALTDELNKTKSQSINKQSDEKKKLKSMSTTLRGEKIILQNTLANIKKKLQDTQEYLQKMQVQNKRLKLQKQNLQSTNQWHANTIHDLRNNFTNTIKEDTQLSKRAAQTDALNQLLSAKLTDQEKHLEQFLSQLDKVEQSNSQKLQIFEKRVEQLQRMIDQKNQAIVKLKMKSTGHAFRQQTPNQSRQDKTNSFPYGTIMSKTMKKQLLNVSGSGPGGSGFQNDMVRILNKKLSDRDYLIEKLQQENCLLKLQIDELKI